MEIIIKRITKDNYQLVNSFTSQLRVLGYLDIRFENLQYAYRVVETEKSTKTYEEQAIEPMAYVDSDERCIYYAFDGDELVGQLMLKTQWNRYGFIEDIRVKEGRKGMGIGTLLMERAKGWCREQQLGGLTLETQNNNVDACLFYQKSGFEIGGIDTHMYKQFPMVAAEIAVFWYWTAGLL